jgi:hypothetical protein
VCIGGGEDGAPIAAPDAQGSELGGARRGHVAELAVGELIDAVGSLDFDGGPLTETGYRIGEDRPQGRFRQ